MDATRARVSSLLEWLVAAACIIAVLAIGSMLVREQLKATPYRLAASSFFHTVRSGFPFTLGAEPLSIDA